MQVDRRSLKIVFLSQRFPLPPDTGGKVRTGRLLRELRRRHHVTLVGNYDARRDAAWRRELDGLCSRYVPVPWREPTRWSAGAWLRRAKAALAGLPLAAAHDHSPHLRRAVEEVCRQEAPDVLVCDFVLAALNCASMRRVPKLLFEHNVESEIARRHYETAGSPLGRLFWRHEWRRTERLERAGCTMFDVVVGVTQRDCRTLEQDFGARCTRAIAPAVDDGLFQPIRARDPRRLLFVGSLDWLPNADGLRFFFEQVFPLVESRVGEIRIRVIGRRPPRWLRAFARACPRVELTDWVDDVRNHAEGSGIFVMPLRVGGGSRVKALEAVAMGIPIVSTTVGAEGLPLEADRHYLRADTADQFADAIVRLVSEPRLAEELAGAARAHASGRFTWEQAARDFEDACYEAIRAFHARADQFAAANANSPAVAATPELAPVLTGDRER
jgi:glycosyltransferase involved in cell wall biosynthesis